MNKNPFNSYYLINARENLGIRRNRRTGKRSLSQTEGAAKAPGEGAMEVTVDRVSAFVFVMHHFL